MELTKLIKLFKMRFHNVIRLSKERRDILNKALTVILENYPDKNSQNSKPIQKFKEVVNAFFLTDHVNEDEDEDSITYDDLDFEHVPDRVKTESANTPPMPMYITNQDLSQMSPDSVTTVRPMSIRKRLSQKTRIENETLFMKSDTVHIYEDDDNNNIQHENTILGDPKKVIGLFIAATHFFLIVPDTSITINLDILLICLFTFFVVGYRFSMPRGEEGEKLFTDTEKETETVKRVDSASFARKVFWGDTTESVRKSKALSFALDANPPINGILKRFPDNAEFGTVPNCWSPSTYSDFLIRGANYLKDRVKVPSADFIFPPRGVEVFLSDCCPAHIGR